MDKLFDISEMNLDQLIFISNAGGHPRSLQYINNIWYNYRNLPFQTQFGIVVENLSNRYRSTALNEAANLLRPIILQKKLEIYEKLIPDTDYTFSTAISEGIYYNDFKPGIPKMAPILYILYLASYDSTLQTQLINCICGVQNQDQFAGKNFEVFHGVWESLFRGLYNTEYMNLKDIYNSSKIITAQSFRDVELIVQEKYKLVHQKGPFEVDVKTHSDIINCTKDVLRSVIHYGGNNPGFDILVPSLCFKKPNTIHMSFIEARYSATTSEKPVDYWKEIHKKYMHCQKAVNYFKSLEEFKRTEMKIDWHYIHVAHRHLLSSVSTSKANLKYSSSMPENMILIGKEALPDIYGFLTEMSMFISDPEEMMIKFKMNVEPVLK